MNDIIADKLNTLPQNPGVYLMYDADGTIIYVGKAKVLKNRVRQYFHAGVKTEKVMAMVARIADLSYIITNSELDALALESNLIKKNKPQYNILLKDDKSHPYLKIDLAKEYPSLEITRRLKRDGAKYFGPFIGVSVKEVFGLVNSAFGLRMCEYKSFPKNHRECLNYHIGLCTAPCTRRITPEDYRVIVDKVIAFLTGKDDDTVEILTKKMETAAENEMFEQAIVYRNRIAQAEKLKTRLIMSMPRDTNADIIYYSTNGAYSAVSVLVIRAGKTLGCETFPFTEANLSIAESVSTFLPQYYDGSRVLPEEVILQVDPENLPAIKEWMRTKYKRAATVLVPKQGVRAQLLDNTRLNVEDYLEKSKDKLIRDFDFTAGACELLQKELGLSVFPKRIECFDISNISGTDKVASMVVFDSGTADRASYRRYRIKTVEGADDFASMNEVLKRRFARLDDAAFGRRPDLIVVDGGKGQLSAALDAMREAGVTVNMAGLAKRLEEIYLPDKPVPVRLPRNHYGLRLLERIRDEAHRFAITYHRNMRSGRYLSELENVEGVGAARLRALYRAYRSIDKIKDAAVDELCAVKSIDKRTAQNIYDYFRAKK
ncbi:MAG: excinuclease ABC subunit UvrC [Clostridiales bacterium]|jgi:excinuclease ABC subunit C|nr:excinuclease ABC subunit UvrC [Clostridiales bacterium]